MPHRYRMSSKCSLCVSLFWIVGFVALLLRGSDSLLDGQKLAAFEKGNTALELPKGNGAEINKTLRIDGGMDEISFMVRRPGCLSKEENDNSVVFWLGGDGARKMRLMWSEDIFRMKNDKDDEIKVLTQTDVLVTLKKDGSATVTYTEDNSEKEKSDSSMCTCDLIDNLNKVQGGKTVKFSMKGKTKCGLKLEFDKRIVEEIPASPSTVSPKVNSPTVKPGVFNSSLSLNLFIVIVVVSVIVLLVIIAVVFYFCCWKLLLRRSNVVDIEAQNTEMKAGSSAVDYSGMPLAEKTCLSPTKGTVEKTCKSKTKEQTEGKAELKGAVKQLSAMGSATDAKRISKKSKGKTPAVYNLDKSSSSVSKQTTSRSEKERREYDRKLKAGEEMTGTFKRLQMLLDDRKKFDDKVASGIPLTARERYLKEMHEIRARYEPKLKKQKRKRHAKQKKIVKEDPDRRPMKPFPQQKTALEIQYQRECSQALDRQMFEPADAPHTDPIDWDQIHEEQFARKEKRQEEEALRKKKLEDAAFSKKKLEDEAHVKKNKQNSDPAKKKKQKKEESDSDGKPKKRSKSNRSGTEKKGGKQKHSGRSDPKTP